MNQVEGKVEMFLMGKYPERIISLKIDLPDIQGIDRFRLVNSLWEGLGMDNEDILAFCLLRENGLSTKPEVYETEEEFNQAIYHSSCPRDKQ